MSLTSSNNTDKNQYTLEIAVSAEAFNAAIDKAYRKNVSKMRVPGFRPGKAPKTMIERMYGEGVFFEDAIQATYGDAYEAAVEEAGINPVDRPEIEVGDISKESGYTFKAVVTVKPQVDIAGYKGLKVNKTVTVVSDEETTAELDRLRERNARIITVTDRAAQMDDNTMIDFDGYVDGVAFAGGKGEGYALTLGSGQFIPGFEEQIVGKNVGEEFDVNVTFPTEYHAEELAGKAAVFKVKLNEIKTRELPVADDEFAKDVSEFDTLAELKADLAKKLQERKDTDSNNAMENELIDAIVEKLKADIPPVMFDRQVDEMVHDFGHRLQAQGLDMATYLQYTGMEEESFRKNFLPQAERQVKVRLALEKIALLEKLEATQAELDEEYDKMAQSYGLEVDKIKTFIPAKDLATDMMVKKAIDFVRENAKITEIKEEAKEKPITKAKSKKEAE